MSDHSIIPVHCCSECPFLLSLYHEESGKDKHYCTQYTKQEPEEVGNPDGKIPRFCPLRKSPVQVTLIPE